MTVKPENVPEDLDQLRPAFVRSVGLTPGERYLAEFADHTFLKLWSYPNPFRAQKQGGVGDGKELCDLLVVCDPHVIIFSEKEISWSDKSVDVAWARWYRKAVDAAADQLRGAERWLRDFPDRLYMDAKCTVPFPLALPQMETRRVHRVVVSRGAAAACKEHFRGGLGTLVIKPALKGSAHIDPKDADFAPFAIGDIDPEGDFAHVFDEVALDIVMRELDTITDFTDYLDKRASFLRSGRLAAAQGEEDLLAYYVIGMNENGEHDFTPPDGKTWNELPPVTIAPGTFTGLRNDDQFQAKKQADKGSYFWDGLIDTFADRVLDGTSVVPSGQSFSISNAETSLRQLAKPRRYLRRELARAFKEAFQEGKKTDRFMRAVIHLEDQPDSDTAFCIMTLKYPRLLDRRGGYKQYRTTRTEMLKAYAQLTLLNTPYLKRVVAVGLEPPGQGRGGSEDLLYAEQRDWSDDDARELMRVASHFNIGKNLRKSAHEISEFPPVRAATRPKPSGNRKQRRAAASKRRRG